jgi:hypothetical protein
MVRIALDEVTRGTTNAVNTLNAVDAMMAIPTIKAAGRRIVSTLSS